VPAPARQQEPPEGADAAPDTAPSDAPEAPPLPLPARLGVVSLALGLVSVPILCLPVIGYAAIGLSGLGLLLGLGGLYGAVVQGSSVPAPASAGRHGTPRRFGERSWDYPLAGLGGCLLALALALLPFLFR
jgi:hypothetical protein